MAPPTVLLFCYRLPTITATEFRDYVENIHAPLVESLLGDKHPLSHTRYYTNKDSGFAVGSPTSDDADLIAVITYASEEHFHESMRARNAEGIGEVIRADEAKFMDRSKVKVIKIGHENIGKMHKEGH